MNQDFPQINRMITHNNNQFRLPHDIPQPCITCCDQANILDSEIDQQKYLVNKEQSINQYYKCYANDYHSQIIYEPEYFLNIQNLNEDNSNNQTNQYSYLSSYYHINQLDFYPNNMDYKDSNHQFDCQKDLKEFQNDQNMHISSKNESDLNEYECENAKNTLFQPIQNGFECEQKIKNYKQNVLESIFEQTEADYSSAIQNLDSKNNRFQLEAAKENKSSCIYQISESKSKQTQNSLKNIVCAFFKHFKQLKDCKIEIQLSRQQIQNLKKQLVRYMKQHSFNYSVVKYLITHKILKQLFLDFLSNDSYEWLSKSKVIDKQDVKEKILFLKNCIIDPKNLEELTNY
ncbi:hypothetical protein TTHERM_00581560 (macronuclear) [Tetrahymena thermophila SB210]|uniref:Uncharacterized protein n=1 Tax=Tetrahymena thermophila (strain SB210) TaxID=312017 RepID=Q23QD0_TETTS|nr:hypothetical protein TTHERM_00581560 [Tetrahymena thermophila SB210]EAR98654.2 hypothetical protein TTHERM_00581560 [Tetrahymena thermophila SB210]|eukprot:XP_001018899.2 hypothetical protein TTHERM_00581560 [Tetrahymena thermophila SB210]